MWCNDIISYGTVISDSFGGCSWFVMGFCTAFSWCDCWNCSWLHALYLWRYMKTVFLHCIAYVYWVWYYMYILIILCFCLSRCSRPAFKSMVWWQIKWKLLRWKPWRNWLQVPFLEAHFWNNPPPKKHILLETVER